MHSLSNWKKINRILKKVKIINALSHTEVYNAASKKSFS